MKVAIIGGGVMGCATAVELARRGVKDIVLLERAVPGAEASSAAAGMLAAQVEAKDDERAAFVRAREAYARWADELRATTGIDIGYRRTGALEIAHGDADEANESLRRRIEGHLAAGLRATLLDAAGAREIEPELGAITGAAWYPDEAQVDPPLLLRALAAEVSRVGVRVTTGKTVTGLVEEGGTCRGVLVEGSRIDADAVLLAAGSWSSLVPGVPSSLPAVRPVRGQLAMLEEHPPRLSRIVFHGGHYVVPRGDGRVVCGSTMEDVGHRREVTAGGIRSILDGALRIAPALAAAELTRVWCNFRPFVEGGARIGASSLPGLFLATGHHRNGILLAKVTAEAAASAIVGERAA